MPLRTPNHTIIFFRNGERVVPEVDKPFDFTKDEIAQIESVDKTALRKSVVEVSDDEATEPEAATPTKRGAAKGSSGKPADDGL